MGQGRPGNPLESSLPAVKQSVGVAMKSWEQKTRPKSGSSDVQLQVSGCSAVKVTKVKDNKLASALSIEGMRVQDKYYTYQNTHIQINNQ